MTKKMSRRMSKSSGNEMWKQALGDAEKQLRLARTTADEWESVVRTCREKIAKDAPWPGESATQN